MKIYDLLGIGFGPSNIALAISVDELRQRGHQLECFFIEKQTNFAWHRDMLLNDADMQISFLKDLATLRNPRSHFTFTNYLFEKGRLQDFINLKTFFPSRQEFNDYLAWAASHFENDCAYNEEVVEVLPEKKDSDVTLLRVISRDSTGNIRERLTRNLVVSIGGTPKIPVSFLSLENDPRIFHSSQYLSSITKLSHAKRIAIIGAGQSATEIFLDLHGRSSDVEIDLIMRGRAMHPSDDSPSVNEIFNTEFTDYMFSRTPEERTRLLKEFHHTNYAAPDIDQIENIFRILYNQKVTGVQRHTLITNHETREAQASDYGIRLRITDLETNLVQERDYDAVILATGYLRSHHKTILAPLAQYLPNFTVTRHYRLDSTPNFKPAIFVQGASETTHGISDSLLSVTAVRTHEIGEAIISIANIDFENSPKKHITA
ncbi:MAG: ornithine monooxygenase [Cellvibrio sp. 79]|nr:MAG: ornithine monooxygenase [Cellvibrio sp. 79]